MSKTKTYEEYKLKSGKKMWHVHAYLGTDSRTGKAKYFDRRKFATKADAKRALIDAKADFQRGLNVSVKNESVLLSQVYAEWKPLHDTQVRPSTAGLISRIWKNFISPQFGDWHLDTISPRECQAWMMRLSQKYSHLENIKSVLHMMLQYAIRMEYVDRNATDAVQLPRQRIDTGHIKKNYFELDELKSFVAKAYSIATNPKSSETKQRTATSLLFLAATGIRVGELCALTWGEIDLDAGEAHIHNTVAYDGKRRFIGPAKTKASVRTVQFGGYALETLKLWQKRQFGLEGVDLAPNQFAFASPYRPDVYMSQRIVGEHLTSVAESAGLRRITPHGLRHTKATLLNEAGVSATDIAAALGHTNPQFTLRTYVHATSSGVQAAQEKFQALVNL
jgi:integrase